MGANRGILVVSVFRDGAARLSGSSLAVGLAGIDLMGRFFVSVGPSSIRVQRTARSAARARGAGNGGSSARGQAPLHIRLFSPPFIGV